VVLRPTLTSGIWTGFYVDGSPVSGATNPTYTYTPPSPSTHTIHLRVTDSVQATKNSNTAQVTVNPTLQVSISPSSAVIEPGQSVSFTSSVSGGTPPYAYQWYKNGAPVSGATGSTWTFTSTSTGSYEIYLRVTDNVGATRNSNTAHVTVEEEQPVGGIWIPVDKLGLLAPYIGLASIILVATAATAIYAKRVKRRKEKQ